MTAVTKLQTINPLTTFKCVYKISEICDGKAERSEDLICVCNTGYAGNGLLCGLDTDLDGFPDMDLNCTEPSCKKDNCPSFPNSGQEDADGNGNGDSCDSDPDNDGIYNPWDNCRLDSNSDQADVDSDGIGDVCDNCKNISNANQKDTDKDGLGDLCDDDIDYDGVLNKDDNCPDASNPNQTDVDTDGQGDACDNCPNDSNPGQEDKNQNLIGDACDGGPDNDSDGIPDDLDNCPLVSNFDQLDTDHDSNNTFFLFLNSILRVNDPKFPSKQELAMLAIQTKTMMVLMIPMTTVSSCQILTKVM